MAPLIHAVRHAQGLHNICIANHTLHDPSLTELGYEQCAELQEKFRRHAQVKLIVTSPLRRTIYTALKSFRPVLQSCPDMKLIALPDTQEVSDEPCDTGTEPIALGKEFSGEPVDLTLTLQGWNSKKGRYEPTDQAVAERARAARRWLKERPEEEIVLVTRGSFLHYFTEDWEDTSGSHGTAWGNTEYRTYTFRDEIHSDGPLARRPHTDNASLIETTESRQRRGKAGPIPDRDEQKILAKRCKQGWNDRYQVVKRIRHGAWIRISTAFEPKWQGIGRMNMKWNFDGQDLTHCCLL